PSLSEDAALIALSLPVGVVVVDAQGRIVMVNQRLCDMFGYPGADLRGKSLEVLLPERYRQGHNALRAAYHAAPVARMMGRGRDLTGLRADGMEFPIEIGLGALPTSRGQLVLATVVDITERKRTELQLREANAQLEEFTSVASHDLRSPLRGVSNLIDFILDDYGDTAPVGVLRNLDRVKDRIGRMEQLIEDLLAYARAGRRSAKLELIDLEDIVEEMVRLDPPPEGFRLETDLDVAPFLGSATPLRTVIRNLYTNAFKHHDLKGGVIRIAARGEGDACVIEIGDDGPGIPVLVQERVFRLFQTLAGDTAPSGTPRLGGSGLGLAVAKRLVEGHGGRIEVNSPDGVRGATFRIHWPRYMRTDLDD
ncbi:MAG TPA: PAS domain-containing sensor histidine kinase, partial [Novosphingobium sp.]|nr:PAS domain-containing sensor histidine kinase [Novosphingobium sp.]